MPEVTLTQASQIVKKDRATVFRWCDSEVIPSRRVGIRRDIRINIDDLKSFTQKYGYEFDAALAAQYAK